MRARPPKHPGTRSARVQLAFSNVPRPVKEAFDREAERRGIGKKELLYACLRLGGIEIPDAAAIDGRRR